MFISHVFRAGENQQRTSAWQVEVTIVIGAPNRRVADLEIESAIRKGAVFMFNKPFATIKQGAITAEQINKDMLIDTHYGAMSWSNAWDLFVQQKAQDKFQRTFCLSWKEALDQGLVYNLVDTQAKLGRTMSEFGASTTSWRRARPGSGFAAVSTAER